MTEEQALKALCRTDFATFVQRAFIEIYPATELVWNWHLDKVIDSLNDMRRGATRRQLTLLPPRSLKSFICSVAWPAFLLGHNPELKIITVSYAQSLADDLARLCRDLITSDWYKSLFDTRLVRGQLPVDHLRTTRRGHRIATSIGGTLTGRGADLIIIDDPMKAEDALSEAMRAIVHSWFSNTLPSRIDNKASGQVLVVMQRLHQDDPAGYLMERGWPALILPAIAPDDRDITYSTAFGARKKRWRKGEALQPSHEPLEVLEATRRDMGSVSFSAQYLLDPEPATGTIIERCWLRRCSDKLPTFLKIVQSWDTASKTGELNDFSVCTTWGITASRHYYLIHVLRTRLDHPSLVQAVIEQKGRYGADIVLVEDKVSGIGVIQDVSARRISGVIAVAPKGDKAMRLVSVSTLFESGHVLLPEWAPWLDDYIRELVTFPGRFDDQVDSTSQALLWLREHGVEPSIITVYREQVEEEERRRLRIVTIQSPDGSHRTLTPCGSFEQFQTDMNGVVSLPAEFAKIYIINGWRYADPAED